MNLTKESRRLTEFG